MREVVCQFDDYVYAALEEKAERLGNTIENIIEFAVVEAVTGRDRGDHVKENTDDFSPGHRGIADEQPRVFGPGSGYPTVGEISAAEANKAIKRALERHEKNRRRHD